MKYKTHKEKTIARLVEACKSASKREKKIRKGINQCDVTFASMLSLMETQQWKCAIRGQSFLIMDKRYKVEERKQLGINSLLLPSIDRIDNNRGYEMDNIRIVTNGYNQLRNRYGESDVMEWILSNE